MIDCSTASLSLPGLSGQSMVQPTLIVWMSNGYPAFAGYDIGGLS